MNTQAIRILKSALLQAAADLEAAANHIDSGSYVSSHDASCAEKVRQNAATARKASQRVKLSKE